MNLKLNDVEFKDVKDLLGGFITKDQEQLKFNLIATPDLSFNTAMQLLQSMTYQMLYAFIKQKPEAKYDIYDAYNFMASSILEQLIPDEDIKLDITEEAILELEEAKIKEKFDTLTEDQKEIALNRIEAIKKRLKNKDADKKD